MNAPFIVYVDHSNFRASTIPDGGVTLAHWRWRPFLLVKSPSFAFPDNIVGLSLVLDTFLMTDGRIAYSLVLYFGTQGSAFGFLGLGFPVWFEQGFLPPDVSPCAPPIFPVTIVFTAEFDGFVLASGEVFAPGFANA